MEFFLPSEVSTTSTTTTTTTTTTSEYPCHLFPSVMMSAVESFDTDAFVEELLDISAVGDGFDDRRDDEQDDNCRSIVEEDLEWISNKDAFPEFETFLDAGLDEPPPCLMFEQGSPVSVLDSHGKWTNIMSNPTVPVRARSQCSRKRRREGFGEIHDFQARENYQYLPLPGDPLKVPRSDLGKGKAKICRKCLHCGSEKTPQWRAGPGGPKTLCNACGVRYKSGRLVPEYRPASSPTFSSDLHSNSHRKILEMRMVKMCVS